MRDLTFDITKSACIFLIVLGHAIIGVRSAIGISDLTLGLLNFIYTFHVHAFFIVSGLFFGGLLKADWRAFFQKLGLRIVFPYFLWSFILMLAHKLMSAYTNSALEAFNPLNILWAPPAVMWFLYALALAMVITKLLAPLQTKYKWAIAIALMVGSYFVTVPVVGYFRYYGIFLVATLISAPQLKALAQRTDILIGSALIFITTFVLCYLEARADQVDDLGVSLWYLPNVFAGALLLVRGSSFVQTQIENLPSATGAPATRLITFVGLNTMAIYVSHILLTAGARIVLMKLGINTGIIIITIATIAGFTVPLIAAFIADKLGIKKYIGW